MSHGFTINLFPLSVLFLATMLQISRCGSSVIGVGAGNNIYEDYYDNTATESPDLVEIIDPLERGYRPLVSQQITIESIKLATKVKLRYARTQITIQLRNSHHRELQTDFKLSLPENALFTIFQLKTGRKPITYRAEIVEREEARRRYHSARTNNNGTVSAGYIELSKTDDLNEVAYNLKFSVPPNESIHSILVYERQLDRISGVYSDQLRIFPGNPYQINSIVVGMVEFVVGVEELSAIDLLRCTSNMEAHYGNCTLREKTKQKPGISQYKFQELFCRKRQLQADLLERIPFEFTYQLEQHNESSTAVIISQSQGNYYFAHLFTPENLPRMPKHVVFLLDVSDSMHGLKLDQVKWSMTNILDDLGSDDFFNIVAFSNDINIWTKFRGERRQCQYPFPVTEENKDSAERFIKEKLIAHGTTNIYQGLHSAFDLIKQFSLDEPPCGRNLKIKSQRHREMVAEKLPPNVESMIFFLSDGKPTSGPRDSSSLLNYFYKLNLPSKFGKASGTEKAVVPIYTIAYGQDADVEFLRTLSRNSGGVTKVIEEESGAGVELADFYTQVSSQILSRVQTFVEDKTNDTGTPFSAQISYPVMMFAGGEVVTAGHLKPAVNKSFISDDYRWSTEAIGKTGKVAYYSTRVYDCTTLEMTVGKCVERIDYYLKKLQAYQKLKKLLERDKMVQQGYICPTSYHQQFDDLKMKTLEDYEQATSRELSTGIADEQEVEQKSSCYNIFKQQAIESALRNGFVTPYTSFILTTENIDIGLKTDDTGPNSVGMQSSGENPTGIGQTFERLPKPEKLIFMGYMSSSNNDRLPTSKLAQLQVNTEVGVELIPAASKLVGTERKLEIEEADQNSVTVWNNTNYNISGVTGGDNSSHSQNFTTLMQDTFKRLFQRSRKGVQVPG